MEKEVHVNAYTKKDGTQVREHYRTIDSEEKENNSYIDKTPLLQGGISYTENGKSDVLKDVLKTSLQILPLVSQICKTKNNQSVKDLNPQLFEQIKQIDNNLIQMKKNIDKSVIDLVSSNSQKEYTKKYEPVLKKYDEYKKTEMFINRLKAFANNNDYKNVVKEIEKFNEEIKNQEIFSDLLNYDENLQKSIDNSNDNIIDNFKHNFKMNNNINLALNNNLSGLNHSADFSNYNSLLVFGNNFFNKDNPIAREMANNYLIKPENAPKSKDYTYIPVGYAEFLNSKYDFQDNKNIPEDWPGFAYNKDSLPAEVLSNSKQLQNQIRNQYNPEKRAFKNEKLEISLNESQDLFRSVNNCTVIEPIIDKDGYFHGILFDKYDFKKAYYNYVSYRKDKSYSNLYSNLFISIANDYFYLLQRAKGHNFYLLIPVSFKL